MFFPSPFPSRAIVLCLALAAFAFTAMPAPAKGPLEIKAGYGLPDIHIGSSEDDALALLGRPYETVTYDQEYNDFVEYGLNPDEFIPFQTGYTHAHVYLDEARPHPVFKVYVANGVVSYLIFSKYNFDAEKLAGYTLNGTVSFAAPYDAATSAMGSQGYCFNDNKHDVCNYRDQGVVLTFDDRTLSAIDVFRAEE